MEQISVMVLPDTRQAGWYRGRDDAAVLQKCVFEKFTADARRHSEQHGARRLTTRSRFAAVVWHSADIYATSAKSLLSRCPE
ncbi:hypothetical protein [Noviherbaspirillum agri]